MIQCSTNSKKLKLDLSFHGPSKTLLEEISEQGSRITLTDADCWELDLREWIQFVRSDQSLICPNLVRETSTVSMGLQLTDDSTVAALNSAWRCKTETTDVLSFPVFDEKVCLPRDQSVELGDIVVSVNQADQQAREHNHSLSHELRWLVSHGLLHLLGWDHPTAEKLNAMLSCQEQLLCIDGNLRSKVEPKRSDR